MFVLLTVLAVSLLFCMLAWALVTAFRIWAVDEPVTLDRRAVRVRRRARAGNRPIPVGARDIRAEQVAIDVGDAVAYSLDRNGSTGIPAEWLDQIWERRN